MSPLIGVELFGLNSSKCHDTHLTVSSQDKNGQNQPIFRTENVESICEEGFCPTNSHTADQISLSIDKSGNVTLDSEDEYRSLQYDRKSNKYRISFGKPAILASQAQNFIIQSTDLTSK